MLHFSTGVTWLWTQLVLGFLSRIPAYNRDLCLIENIKCSFMGWNLWLRITEKGVKFWFDGAGQALIMMLNCQNWWSDRCTWRGVSLNTGISYGWIVSIPSEFPMFPTCRSLPHHQLLRVRCLTIPGLQRIISSQSRIWEENIVPDSHHVACPCFVLIEALKILLPVYSTRPTTLLEKCVDR